MTSGRTLQRFVASGVGEATWRTVIITVLLAGKPKTCGHALQNTKSLACHQLHASCTSGFTIILQNSLDSPVLVLCYFNCCFFLGLFGTLCRNLPTHHASLSSFGFFFKVEGRRGDPDCQRRASQFLRFGIND